MSDKILKPEDVVKRFLNEKNGFVEYKETGVTQLMDEINAYSFSIPKNTYEIRITDHFTIYQTGKPPNWFRRNMIYLFLGWRIKIYE